MSPNEHASFQEIHRLPLTDDGAPDVPGEYIYLPPPADPAYHLRFEIEGTSSICRQGSLWVNIPNPGTVFRRDQYQEYKCVDLSCIFICLCPDMNHVKTAPRLQWHSQDRHSNLNCRFFRLLHHLHSFARTVIISR